MHQEDIIYNGAKDSLRKYGRVQKKTTNEGIIYECAAVIYSIHQDYKEDTRNYRIVPSIYELEKEMIYKLQLKIRYNEDKAAEADDACRNALTFIELVVKPGTKLSSLAC